MSSTAELTRDPESSPGSVTAERTAAKPELVQLLQTDSELEGGKNLKAGRKKRSQRNRFQKLGTFVLIELLWLGFGLFVGLRTETIKLKSRTYSFLGHSIDTVQISQSTLSFIAGLYQTAALVFPGAIVADVYASEWYYLLRNTMSNAVDKTKVDKVSLLTSGAIKRLEHLVDRKRASRTFSLAILVSILLIPLHSMMISTVTIGPVSVNNTTQITIGTLPAIRTFSETDENAQNVQQAARDAYISEVKGSFLGVVRTDSFISNPRLTPILRFHSAYRFKQLSSAIWRTTD